MQLDIRNGETHRSIRRGGRQPEGLSTTGTPETEEAEKR